METFSDSIHIAKEKLIEYEGDILFSQSSSSKKQEDVKEDVPGEMKEISYLQDA